MARSARTSIGTRSIISASSPHSWLNGTGARATSRGHAVDPAVAAGADVDGMSRPEAEDGLHLGLVRVLGLEEVLVADARSHQVDLKRPTPVLALRMETHEGVEGLVRRGVAAEDERERRAPVLLPPVLLPPVLDAQSLRGHIDVVEPGPLSSQPASGCPAPVRRTTPSSPPEAGGPAVSASACPGAVTGQGAIRPRRARSTGSATARRLA